MIDAGARQAVLHLDKLEAMTAVCSVGLDMIAIPGDTSEETICAIIADEISIGVANNKTTACRLIPAYGCKVGDEVEFGGLLGSAPVMEVGRTSPARFIARGRAYSRADSQPAKLEKTAPKQKTGASAFLLSRRFPKVGY